MEKIHILTDSSSDIPHDLVEAHGIEIVPIMLTHEGRSFREYYDTHPRTTAGCSRPAARFPGTAMTTPTVFLESYNRAFERGCTHLLAVLINGSGSGTYQAACLAKSMFEEEQGEGSRLRARLLELNRDAARFYYELLHDKRGEACAEYLNQRRITRRTAVNFGLGASADEWDGLLTAMTRKGYSKAELLAAGLVVQGKGGSVYDKFRKRLIFPIIDVRGDVLGFGGRIISKDDPGAKYMNTPETIVYSKRRVLYGLNLAKKSKRSNIIWSRATSTS